MENQAPTIEVSLKTPGLRSGISYDVHITTRDANANLSPSEVEAEVTMAVLAWRKATNLMDEETKEG